MDLKKLDTSAGGEVLSHVKDMHWSQQVAAGSLVAGAVLLERPEVAQDVWSKLPGYIRNGQDFLVKAESFVEKLGEQAARLRETLSRQA
jgi:hypothetical protein